jgi:hypothetical protein
MEQAQELAIIRSTSFRSHRLVFLLLAQEKKLHDPRRFACAKPREIVGHQHLMTASGPVDRLHS